MKKILSVSFPVCFFCCVSIQLFAQKELQYITDKVCNDSARIAHSTVIITGKTSCVLDQGKDQVILCFLGGNSKSNNSLEKKAEDALSTAVNGIVYHNVALKDAHNEEILGDVKTTCSWKVFNGQMTKLDAELKVFELETKIKNSNIKNEALAKSCRVH